MNELKVIKRDDDEIKDYDDNEEEACGRTCKIDLRKQKIFNQSKCVMCMFVFVFVLLCCLICMYA